MLGTYALSSGYYDAYYLKALKVRNLIRGDFVRAFERCDCLMMPVAPTTAFKIGEKVDDPLKMYLADIYTIAVNLAGIPGISVPCGFDDAGLPIGLQILTARPSARPSCCGSPGCTRPERTGTRENLRLIERMTCHERPDVQSDCRPGDSRAAQHADEDVLRLCAELRRGGEQPGLSRCVWVCRGRCR